MTDKANEIPIVSKDSDAQLMLAFQIGIGVTHMQQRTAADARLAAVQLNGLDVELFESLEIADNFELINELELLSDMEFIQELEWIEAS